MRSFHHGLRPTVMSRNKINSKTRDAYPWSSTLPLLIENGRDPRKIWLYEVMQGSPWVTEQIQSGYMTYCFKREQDLLMFTLRWS